MAYTILLLGLIVFLAYLFRAVFDLTRIPDVLLLMVLGILLGPVLGMASNEDFGKAGPVLASLTLIVILLESGTSLHLTTLRRTMTCTLGLTLLSFFVTMAAVAVTGRMLFDLPWILALMLGGMLGGTSSAVVIPMVQGLRLTDRTTTVLVMESALTDVLCIVSVYALLDATRYGDVAIAPMAMGVLTSFVVAALVGLAGGVGWLLILRSVRRIPASLFASIAFAMILYGAVEQFNVSGAITVLAFGITLTNRSRLGLARLGKLPALRGADLGFFREWVFLLKIFFFIYLGLSLRFDDWHLYALAAGMVLGIYLLRLFLAALTAHPSTPRREGVIMAMMAPKGLAAAVLAGVPLQEGIAQGALMQSFTFIVVLVSIVLTALLVPLLNISLLRRPFEWPLRKLSPDVAPGVPRAADAREAP
jgi:NhaP-type Na+/H+ or K+/H+ antiporter